MLPLAEVPPQNIAPWCDALRALLETPAAYARLSRTARSTALAHNATATVVPFEQHLLQLSPADRPAVRRAANLT
jgi:predicted TIM-barrel fold metal-dependent hydrolase